jgi:hypothetical protein
MRGPAPNDQLIVLDGKKPKHGSSASVLSAVRVREPSSLHAMELDTKSKPSRPWRNAPKAECKEASRQEVVIKPLATKVRFSDSVWRLPEEECKRSTISLKKMTENDFVYD